LERETGIEPATNSLEGCDSTTELLPPSRFARFAAIAATARQARFLTSLYRRPSSRIRFAFDSACHERGRQAESNGGEGRIRTFEAAGATDLQSVAFDRFATSPIVAGARRGSPACSFVRPLRQLVCQDFAPLAIAPLCVCVHGKWRASWSWRRDLNPRPADYKSAALPD
jgi:hypothetical protein